MRSRPLTLVGKYLGQIPDPDDVVVAGSITAGRDVLAFLVDAVQADSAGATPPSLLPTGV